MTEVETMRESGKYSSVSELTPKGGYVAIEKSNKQHTADELDAARILSENGYKVILKDESGEGKTPDGYIFSLEYEQRTPEKDKATTIRNALFHARNKGADVALIYSKNNAFSRQSVENGIKLYEEAHDYRVNRIIVVADNGHIHTHKHNK